MKIAFIYPGQGAQSVGMGKDFYENSRVAKEVFDLAEKILDIEVVKLCFEKNELINDTRYTQALLVTACLAITEELKNKGVVPNVTAGLSLGEYAAIATSGGMTYKDAILTVRKRGIFMYDAVPNNQGTMAAILGLDSKIIEKTIEKIDNVWIANYNCPGQIVITGKKEAVNIAMSALKDAGARRTIELNVSGPFHSKLLEPAGVKLKEVLDNVQFSELEIPYVTNVTGKYVTDIKQTKDLLVNQVSSSVLWEQSVEEMINQGVDTFVEIGPGRTLTGFIRKIDKSVKVLNVQGTEDISKVMEALKC